MEFGAFFSMQLPRPWDADAEQTLFQESLSQAELADRLGIDFLWVVEQHFLEEYSHSSAPEIFLAAASQRTTRIRLGHGVVLMPPGYNHPARVAERIASLDLASRGRVEFGIGDSKSRMELEGFGIEAPDRRAMSLEAIEQVAHMLALDPYPGHRGKYFSMPVRNVIPKPVQTPHPPLWIACSDDATMHLAAQLGVGVLAHGFFDTDEAERIVTDYYDTFKRECVPIGHTVNPNVAMLNPFYCHPDEREAIQRGTDAHGFGTFAVRHYYSFGRHRPGRTDIWRRFESVTQEMGAPVPIRGNHAIGTPDQIAEHLRAFEGVGVDQVIFMHQAGRIGHAEICESLELFAGQVMPEFTRRQEQHRRRKQEELAPFVQAAFDRKGRVGRLADEDIPTIDAYGLSRPDVDISTLPESAREAHMELQRVKQIAMELPS